MVRFHAPGDVRVEDAPPPEPGPDDVLIRVRATAVCGTDLKILRFGHHRMVAPRVLGHEVAGEVISGPGVQPGERVQTIAAIACGQCPSCLRGQLPVCPDQEVIGYHYDGGFAEFMVVPAKALAIGGLNRIPDGLDFAEAALAEPLACVLNGQSLAYVGSGDDVVVVGAGPVGCLHARLARSRGAKRIFLIDVNGERLAMAAALVQPDAAVDASLADVVETIGRLTDGRGADVVIIANGSGEAQEQALLMAAPQGRISLFGGLPRANPMITIDANLVHYRELTIVGAANSTPAQNAQALALIASGAVPVADLITQRLPLAEALTAFDLVARGKVVKVVLEP